MVSDAVRERARRKYDERKAAGLCLHCGGEKGSEGRGCLCGPCWEKQRERGRARTLRRRAEGKVVPREPQPPTEVRCPDCGGDCMRRGFDKDGVQRYRCKVCGKSSRGARLRYHSRIIGGEVMRLSFALHPQADWALTAYCLKHRVSAGQAVREIFRKRTEEPSRPMGASQTMTLSDGRRVTRVIGPKPQKVEPLRHPVYLPNLAPAATRARMQRPECARYRPTVMVARSLAVRLDGLALAGLLMAMRSLNKNHQEAARFLIARAGGFY